VSADSRPRVHLAADHVSLPGAIFTFLENLSVMDIMLLCPLRRRGVAIMKSIVIVWNIKAGVTKN